MKDLSKYTINENTSVVLSLVRLNELVPHGVLFVISKENKLIGSLTDGDIRRGLIKGLGLNETVVKFCNRNPRKLIADENQDIDELLQFNIDAKIIPIVNEKNIIIDLNILDTAINKLPICAVIMAGGLGSRLRPLTLEVPKPLLKVGPKPIIQHNTDRLRKSGISKIIITVNYLADKIIDFYKNIRNENVEFIKETKPLGTIGSIALRDKSYEEDYVLLMNSDLLTDINYRHLYDRFIKSQADMIVATIPYEYTIPYGIVNIQDSYINGIEEKPTYTHYANAGIYIFKTEYVNRIPEGKIYNATDLMNQLIKEGKRVVHYPILSYWLDIGKKEDFERAQRDIAYIDL